MKLVEQPGVVRKHASKLAARLLVYGFLTAASALFLLPFYWMIATALKPRQLVYRFPPDWLAGDLTLANFREGWTALPFDRFFINTVFVTILIVVGTVGSSSLVGFGLVFALFIRPDIEMTVAPIRNPINVTLSDGSIRNTYDLRLRNKNSEPRDFALTLIGDLGLRIELEGVRGNVVTVPADTALLQRAYVVTPPGSAPAEAERTEFRFWVVDQTSGERSYKDSTFFGKGIPK